MSRTRDPKLFNYSLTGQVLEEVLDAKYLGVTLSNDLEWSKHIAIMTDKANSEVSFLRRNLKGCPEKLKQTAYFSMIHSFMEYGATVWDPYQKYNSDKFGGCSVELQCLSKVGVQDTLVFLRQEARLILLYQIIIGLTQLPYKDTIRKHNMFFLQIGHTTSQYGLSVFSKTISLILILYSAAPF